MSTISQFTPAKLKAWIELYSGTIVGPIGPEGPEGPQGIQGIPGNDGADGTNGTNGIDGTDGADGATGPVGPEGPQGIQGPTGADGTDGVDGDTMWDTVTGGINYAGGKVGIGDTSPTNLLTLKASGNSLPIKMTASRTYQLGDPASVGIFGDGGTDGTHDLGAIRFSTSDDRGNDGAAGWTRIYAGGSSSNYTSKTEMARFAHQGSGTDYITLYTEDKERMRIDASGNVGIGTAAPVRKLHIDGGTDSTVMGLYGDTSVLVDFRANAGAGGRTAYIQSASNGSLNLANEGGAQFTFRNGGAERMRIDSSGHLLVSTTNPSPATNNVEGIAIRENGIAEVSCKTGSTPLRVNKGGTGTIVQFYINGTTEGKISVNTGTTPVFASGSDRRLKTDIRDMEGELENVLALRPVDFTMKACGSASSGFIAQEVQEIWPHKVLEDPDDAGMLSIAGLGDTDARLIKAIQEQQEMINKLVARVEELEGANTSN